MASKNVGIEQARKRLGDLVTEVATTGQPIILTRNGRPAAQLAPLEHAMHTYTYAIESSNDDDIWQPVTNGTEDSDDAIEEYARTLLDKWLDDKRANEETTSGWRVRVWHGWAQDRPEADYVLEAEDLPVIWSVVRGESPTAHAVEPGAASVTIPDEILEWAEEHGLSVDDPDVYLLVTPADEAGEVIGEIAYREGTVSPTDGAAIRHQLAEDAELRRETIS